MCRSARNHARALGLPIDGRGFTLIELLITLTVLSVVMIVLTTVMYTAARNKTATGNRIESVQASRVAVDMMARDLRSAGYGADLDYTPTPQPPIAYVDSLELLINANLQPYPDTASVHKSPLAYNPTGNPKPYPLTLVAWTPPTRYFTGAEVVRWTLDINNDGAVNAADITSGAGADAKRTPNPDDYVLARQVYGDSTNNVQNNNGGALEQIALIRAPGGTIPPLFTVYLRGQTQPWDWSSGPVPASMLDDVERVVVRVVATSAKPDWRGDYAETPIQTEVYSFRNTPDFGGEEFAVDGYVFNDLNENGVKNSGEPGLSNAFVSLGTTMSTTTNASGYFVFMANAGTYTLRHTPPVGFKVLTHPDSFVVTVGPGATRSFADTAMAGGWVTAEVFEDLDKDLVKDPSDPWRSGAKVEITPNPQTQYTTGSGQALLFAQTGDYTVTLTVPDSFACLSANPVDGTMTNGGSATHQFALTRQSPGTVRGKVWNDKNANGVIDSGEPGMLGAWVGVTSNGGSTVLSYCYTDVNGDYEITVPANDPPATSPYSIECIPPGGYFPTTTTEITPIFIQAAQTLTGKNFGVSSFTKITLNASRVLSLASGDLIEKDWGTNTANARGDADIVLGADASGTNQLSVWFNQYNSSPLFTASATYNRTAPHSVLALAVDSLSEDPAPFSRRLDVVAGTQLAAAGNFFVWKTQSTSGNEGYITNSYTLGYRTADNGDVLAVGTADVIGGTGIDILVGTKSPTSGQGTIEIWQSNNAASPTFSRYEIYPPKGNIPGSNLGEVTALKLVDLHQDGGKPDMIVGTRKSSYSGQLMIFDGNNGGADKFKVVQLATLDSAAVTAITCTDYDLDNKVDIVLAAQTSSSSGVIEFWHNTSSGPGVFSFHMDTSLAVTGIPVTLSSGDLGGQSNPDILVGFRANNASYQGAILVYYMDNGTVPPEPTDPSGGAVTEWAPTTMVNNFNYGVKPALPTPPYLIDIAVGLKSSATTGALVLFIR